MLRYMNVGVIVGLVAAGAALGEDVPFAERLASSGLGSARCVMAADLDGDADADLIVGSHSLGQVYWLENDGQAEPSFAPHALLVAPAPGVSTLCPVDLDGDGDVDVVFGSWGQGVEWLENDGLSPPSFQRRLITSTIQYVFDLCAADVNGDGAMDVLSASFGDDTTAWYESDGASPPSFTPRVAASTVRPVSVWATDFDGDSDVDVLDVSWYSHTVRWYENQGGTSPTFVARRVYHDEDAMIVPGFLRTGFMNADDRPDVLVATRPFLALAKNQTPQTIASLRLFVFYPNAATPPEFGLRIVYQPIASDSVWPVDINADGWPDMITTYRQEGLVLWHENPSGAYNYVTRVISRYAAGPRFVHHADLDADGDQDVVSANDDGTVIWYENGACRGDLDDDLDTDVLDFGLFASAFGGPTPGAFADGDLDGDADVDVLDFGIFAASFGCDGP